MTLSFATLRAANVARLPLFKNSRGEPAHSKPDGSDWSINDWITAILGELGEAANLVKIVRRGDMPSAAAREAIGKELADVVIYSDLTAFQLGIVLDFNFSEIRNLISVKELLFLGDCMAHAMISYGDFAACSQMMNSKNIATSALKQGLMEIDNASRLIDIDLGSVVISKFNEVSLRVKAPIFINEDNCVIDQNGNLITAVIS